MADDYPIEYLQGILLYNAGEHFEAHEVWEGFWRGCPSAEREFYKGLIQVAVALCHFYNGNARGARRLYHSSNAHLASYRPQHQGLNLDEFLDALAGCFAPLLEAKEDWVKLSIAGFPQIELVPPPAVWPEMPTLDDED